MAINFNGGTDTVRYGSSGFNNQVGCVTFWLKTSGATANTALMSYWTGSSRSGWGILLNNTANKVSAAGYDATAQRIILASTTSVNDGNWHHIAFNYNAANGGANSLYVDGVSEATGNSSAVWTPLTAGGPFTVGDNNDAFWASIVGDFAEVGIWLGSNLTADEIAALAKGYQARFIKKPQFYAPFVRSARDLYGMAVSSQVGTSASAHPRVYGAFF